MYNLPPTCLQSQQKISSVHSPLGGYEWSPTHQCKPAIQQQTKTTYLLVIYNLANLDVKSPKLWFISWFSFSYFAWQFLSVNGRIHFLTTWFSKNIVTRTCSFTYLRSRLSHICKQSNWNTNKRLGKIGWIDLALKPVVWGSTGNLRSNVAAIWFYSALKILFIIFISFISSNSCWKWIQNCSLRPESISCSLNKQHTNLTPS